MPPRTTRKEKCCWKKSQFAQRNSGFGLVKFKHSLTDSLFICFHKNFNSIHEGFISVFSCFIPYSPDFHCRDFESVILMTSQLQSWGRKLGYSCCFHCMYPLEEPDQCIARLTQGQIISLPENSWTTNEYEKPSPVSCPKTGVLYCSETCLKKADYDYMRLLLRKTPLIIFNKT